MAAALDILLVLAGIPVALAAFYLGALALLSRRPRLRPYAEPHLRFDLIVPAHDEEAGIVATVESLLAVDYPAALRRVVVVADNCRDATAARARAAGAVVLERQDAERRGKGYALAHAFEWLQRDGFADAAVVVDADTLVSANLLQAFAQRLDDGAAAVQANNVVGNPDASWRTRLMAVAFTLINTLRSIARERLGCSIGLRGNGMCLAVRTLREVPHEAFSVVEDLEYGIRLGTAGHRVHFAYEGRVASVMVTSASAARTQRLRWEGGRRRLARVQGRALVLRGLARRDRVLLDLGLDLLVPPLALVGAAAALGCLAAWTAAALLGRVGVAPWLWTASVLALCTYVVRGWWISGTGLRGITALFHAPYYLLWKVGLALSHGERGSAEWVRTHREQQAGGQEPAVKRSEDPRRPA